MKTLRAVTIRDEMCSVHCITGIILTDKNHTYTHTLTQAHAHAHANAHTHIGQFPSVFTARKFFVSDPKTNVTGFVVYVAL